MSAFEEKISEELDDLYNELEKKSASYLGYPCNADLDELKIFSRFLKFPINNIGDPFTYCNFQVNTRKMEKEVIEFFSDLYKLEDYWGYVTNGGTEGNLYGMFLGRELLGKEPTVYYSNDVHYSIAKLVRLLNLKAVKVKSDSSGEINYQELCSSLKLNGKNPALIVANIGTTMKGATDRIEKIEEICREAKPLDCYIHADAALGGMIVPFLDDAPKFDFSLSTGSISVSGHKLIGSPIPCGIVLARKDFVNIISNKVEYLETLDTTVSGSRNGLTVLFMWYYIRKFGKKGFKNIAEKCVENCRYLVKKLNGIGWTAWRNDFSNIALMKKPNEKLTKKWQIATQGDIAHIIVMRHTNKNLLDEFLEDLEKEM